jgi:hypothetical protein
MEIKVFVSFGQQCPPKKNPLFGIRVTNVLQWKTKKGQHFCNPLIFKLLLLGSNQRPSD